MSDVELIKSLIQNGENHKTEFKEDFDWSNKEKKIKYIKTLVGLYNHEGGYLLFGVNDEAKVLGITDDFEKIDDADVTKLINNYFHPAINNWRKFTVEINDLKIGIIQVEKRQGVPAICKQNYPQILSESDIYFRYHSETTKIKSGEFLKILLELSEVGQVNEMKRVRKKDIRPVLSINSNLYHSNVVELKIENQGRCNAIVKKLIPLIEEGTQFLWNSPSEYGEELQPKKTLRLAGFSNTLLALKSPFSFRIIYADIDYNLYFQDFSKSTLGQIINVTEPKDYNYIEEG